MVAAAWLWPIVAFPSSPALAHTALIGSEPADRAVLSQAPSRLVLRFSEPVSPLVFRLLSPGGRAVMIDGAATDGEVVDLAAPKVLGQGTHALSWRVVSADGHPVGGTIVFSIGAPSEGLGGGERKEWPVLAFVWGTKLLLYLGLFVGIGGTAYGALVQPLDGPARRIVRGFIAAGLAAAPLGLSAQGLDALGSPLADAYLPAVWAAGFSTAFGRTVAIAAASLALGLLATRRAESPLPRVAALLALLGVGAALAASGHASSAPPRWATMPAVFAHGVAVAFWIGGLLPLGLALQEGGPSSREALSRFSRLIPWAIAPLAASGFLLAIVQLETPSALWTTAYGAVLIAKLVLLAVLFSLAAFNRWGLTRSVVRGKGEDGERLVASIAVECAVAILVLAVVATWRFTPPPRALAEAGARPAVARIAVDGLTADISIFPGRAGRVVASGRVATDGGTPLTAKEAKLTFLNPAAGIEPIGRPASGEGDGEWQAEAVLPLPGRWKVRLDLFVDDFTLHRFEGEIDLRP